MALAALSDAPPPMAGPVPAPAGELLAAITGQLAAGGDLHALLQQFLEPVVQLAGAQGGTVRVFDERGGALRLVGARAMPEGLCGRDLTVDRHCGVCGAAALGDAPRWSADLAGCRAHGPGDTAAVVAGPGLRLLAVPLQHRGEPLGMYNLFFDVHQPAPDAPVMTLLRTVGELLGLALHHARLEQAQVQATLLHERQKMAAEVHDSLGQSLTFFKMRLPLLEDALAAGDDPRALQYCAELRREATQAHAALRSVLSQLRAPMDPQGLWSALQASTEQFRRRGDTALDYVNELPGLALDADGQAQVFHIVQEALNNIARHARAHHAWLHIGRDPAGGVAVQVADDGAGLPPEAGDGGSHYGLAIMRERAQRLGGALQVTPREGGGTVVRLQFPLPPGAAA